MHTLITELTRLYLPPGAPTLLAQGHAPASLVTDDGRTRAVVITFRKQPGDAGDQHWRRLCDVANALQGELGLPAPAVSIDGDNAFGLWLSLATALPVAQALQFRERLRAAYFPDTAQEAAAPKSGDVGDVPDVAESPELPPGLHPRSGRWSAFIHPDLGASFADEAGLDMAPPSTGQAALLEGLRSISDAQLAHAMALLPPAPAVSDYAPLVHAALTNAPLAAAPLAAALSSAPAPGLLLKDATLEDIVRHLHAQNIEPTFRHLLPASAASREP